jgi:hypothetical protein
MEAVENGLNSNSGGANSTVPQFLETLKTKLDFTKAFEVDVLKAPKGLLVRHSQFVYCNTGGWARRIPWAAKITGYDPKYRFAREFLDRETIDGVTYQCLPELPAVIQFHGGSTKNEYKPYYYLFSRDGSVFAIEVSETTLLETLAECE